MGICLCVGKKDDGVGLGVSDLDRTAGLVADVDDAEEKET